MFIALYCESINDCLSHFFNEALKLEGYKMTLTNNKPALAQ